MEDRRARTIIALALRAGEIQLSNSMSVAEVVDALHRICDAFGLEGVTVLVELNTVTISYLEPDLSGSGTVVRVVEPTQPHVHRLTQVRDLVEAIERGEVTLEEASDRLTEIESSPDPYHPAVQVVARLASVAAWTLFAGGDAISMVAAVLAAVVVRGAFTLVVRSRVPEIFATVVSSLVVVLVPYGLGDLVDYRVSPAVVGGLYQLLPGAALVAAVTDGLSGALQSATARGLQAMVTAVGVALGVLGGLSIADGFGIVLPDVPAGPWAGWVTALAAAVAVGLLAVARLVPLRFALAIGPLAAVVWGVSWLGSTTEADGTIAVGAAALILGVASGLLSRLQRGVPTMYTSTAVLVLVPGTTIYLAMLSFARGANEAGLTLTIDALAVSLAIAAGTTLGLVIGRTVPRPPSPLALLPRGRDPHEPPDPPVG